MGTPDFAVQSLKTLVENNYQVIAVVTAPDKPSGRGLQLHPSPVKKYAVENHIPVFQPMKLKSPEFIESLKSLQADLQIVVAFRMLPEIIWSMPRLGTINLHASLLPDYRGAAPINWAIINGEKETGITTFFLKHEIDTGDVLLTEKIPIGENENAGQLHDKLMEKGAELILKSVELIAAGNYSTTPQTRTSDKSAPKIFKENCIIDWNNDVEQIRNFVRGLSPYPTAYTLLENKILKVFEVKVEQSEQSLLPGSILTDNKSYLKFAAKNGYVSVIELQLEGKKRMPVQEFLKGYQVRTT